MSTISERFDKEFRTSYETKNGEYDDKWLNCSVPEIKSFFLQELTALRDDIVKMAEEMKENGKLRTSVTWDAALTDLITKIKNIEIK